MPACLFGEQGKHQWQQRQLNSCLANQLYLGSAPPAPGGRQASWRAPLIRPFGPLSWLHGVASAASTQWAR